MLFVIFFFDQIVNFCILFYLVIGKLIFEIIVDVNFKFGFEVFIYIVLNGFFVDLFFDLEGCYVYLVYFIRGDKIYSQEVYFRFLGFFFFFKNYLSDVLIVSDEVCYFCEK